MPLAIEADRVGKRYVTGGQLAQYQTLRDALSSLTPSRRRQARASRSELWALRDVSFTVQEGQLVGVIGRNGAGKSTLLRILARITTPTTGVSRTRGRVGSLLEVGTGFHHELTGRENVFLNGAVLGLSRKEIRRRFERIADFSGVGRFLDTPLKYYSTGMQLRLAFAVAAHLDQDTMVVDEVLAVGDAEFQRRCLGKMSEITAEGRTAVFVSHDLGAVVRLCPRTIWLDRGRIQADGPTEKVVDTYLKVTGATNLPMAEFQSREDAAVQLLSVAVTDPADGNVTTPRRDQQFSIRIGLRVRERVPALDVSAWIINPRGITVLHESWSDARISGDSADEPGDYAVTLTVAPLLPAGEYLLCVWVGHPSGPSGFETLVEQEALRFEVRPLPNDLQDSIQRDRVAQPQVSWHVVPTPSLHEVRS